MRTLTITLDDMLYEKLVEHVVVQYGPVEAGRKRSEIIREALAAYLQNPRKETQCQGQRR